MLNSTKPYTIWGTYEPDNETILLVSFIMWQSLAGGKGAQGMDWNGSVLKLAGSGGTEISIPAADLLAMMQAALDSGVQNEARQPEGDVFRRARDAIGGSVGSTHTGFTYATAGSIGTQMTRTSGSVTFDIGHTVPWATSIGSLCRSAIPDVSGQLMRK